MILGNRIEQQKFRRSFEPGADRAILSNARTPQNDTREQLPHLEPSNLYDFLEENKEELRKLGKAQKIRGMPRTFIPTDKNVEPYKSEFQKNIEYQQKLDIKDLGAEGMYHKFLQQQRSLDQDNAKINHQFIQDVIFSIY